MITDEPARANTLPEGFFEEAVIRNLESPMAFDFAKDGSVVVAEQSGRVKLFDSLTDPTPDLVADLSANVHHFWDRGMLGMAVDPDFPATPHIYVLYAYDYNPVSETHDVPSSWGDGCPTPPGPTDDGCVVVSRLSRLVLGSDPAATQEHVLIQDWCQQAPTHSVGKLAFGSDGALYASAGDGATFAYADYGQEGAPPNPCGDPPTGVGGTQTPPTAEGGALRSQDLQTSGDPVGLSGTVIRIDPATGEGMPDNPLADHADPNARRIVAYGLRNPFRFTIRPDTSEIWLGDVGWRTWEEINRITDPTSGPVNFGWPCYEGQDRQSSYDGLNLDICENLYELSPGDLGAHSPPHFAYQHEQDVVGEACVTGTSSISGLAFYEGGNYPAEYNDALFFVDYSRACIWVMKPDDSGDPAPQLLTPFFEGSRKAVDIKVGPDGDLYYLNFNPNNLSAGTIRHIGYDPDAVPPATDCDAATGTDLIGVDVGGPVAPGSAEFASGVWSVSGSGAGVSDPSDSFHFACQPLTGDGTITARVGTLSTGDPASRGGVMMRASTAADAPHAMVAVTNGNGVAFQYRSAAGGASTEVAGPTGTAPRWVRLTRSGDTLTGETSADGATWTTIGSTTIDLGADPRTGLAVTSHNDGTLSTATFDGLVLPGPASNTPPVASIAAPTAADTWSVGEVVAFSGSATDAEDGDLAAADLHWNLLLHHCSESDPTDCHIHPVESFDGVASAAFTAPDHEYPSFLELQLTATDSNGEPGFTSVELQPNTVDLTFNTDPTGLDLVVGSVSDAAPITKTFIVGGKTGISAPSPQTLGGTDYLFSAWSHGGAQTQTLTVPATDTSYTATYTASGGPDTTAPDVTHADPGGTVTIDANGEITVTGAATDNVGIASVGLAIKDTATGDWWNPQTGTWGTWARQPATLTNPGAATTNWSMTFPADPDGSYRISAIATDTTGNQSTNNRTTITATDGTS